MTEIIEIPKPIQLCSNIMFALQDGGVLKQNKSDVIPVLEQATAYLKKAILVSNPSTKLFFIDDQQHIELCMELDKIALDANGQPMISSTIGTEPYGNDIHVFALFGWKTKNGEEYSAAYPEMAFYC